MIRSNLDAVMVSVQSVCRRVGRDPSSVTVVAVTKYTDAVLVNEALAAGIVHVAENRVQSAQEKFPLLQAGAGPVVKHLIGHLQTNKVRDAVQLFDLIHSVDSLKLAQEIDKRAGAIGKVQDILVQVDIAREEQKFGLPEETLEDFMNQVQGLLHVRVLGLMCMAPLTKDKEIIRGVFHRLKGHFDRLKAQYAGTPGIAMMHLSMGMSGDYEIAIEEGATMVRIGSAIFK
ncbi:MAG: YggS family pyridoxal phosphate-dependent enzyme [Candidatus Omnitrophota bacterium]